MEDKKQELFIDLRASGQSYTKISAQLKVSKSTLIRWSRQFKNDIANAKALQIDQIRQEYLINRQHKLRVLGTGFNQVTEEILSRDLSQVPTWRLYHIQRLILDQLDRDPAGIEFIEESKTDGLEPLRNLSKKTEKWPG